MRRLPQITLLILLCFELAAQSPHGKEFKMDCGDCHTTEGWKINAGTFKFNHDTTRFPLIGQHQQVNCRSCHTSLVFARTGIDCMNCHTDMHEQTVGFECARCHTPKSWLVENITEIHQLSRFPLVGPHMTADCYDCHPSASLLRFEPLGVECYDCHQENYMATTNPNHVAANFSTDCSECHLINSFTWSGSLNHSFFPLTGGHEIGDCFQCHKQGEDYSSISAECVSCHQTDYNNTTNPNHSITGIPTDCIICHTTSPGWKPADFDQHDVLFPIYSGQHNGEWNSCSECHTNPGNYSSFSCIDCHEHNQGDTDDEHDDVGGYFYESNACFECHPTGDAEESFNHNSSNFPLTGAHITTACDQCHSNGYSGTPTICFACHENDYNQSINPNHSTAGIATDCEVCHTTEPEWKPALFPDHNVVYPLLGAHGRVSNCFACHEGNYVNTPNQCYSCHSEDYNQTTNPPHESSQFSTSCETCHNETAWTPSTFDHDGQYFPIYSGNHAGEWTECNECHTNPSNYGLFSCIDCHDHNQADTDAEHDDVGGYSYNSMACFECHPTGEGEGGFNHNNSNFPLTGAHVNAECLDCHANGYAGTPTLCFACHEGDFNLSVNPNHNAIGIPNDCESCHTTIPGWEPAEFAIHDNYYPLTGEHTTVATDCYICHQGDYNNTPNACVGCHLDNYNQSANPDHDVIAIPTDCEVCHTTSPEWQPASFPIHDEYWPLTGAHLIIASNCFICHAGNYNSTPNTCVDCHLDNYNGTTDPNHIAAQFPTDCEACHATNAWTPATFEHDGQYFPIYSGEHQGEWNSCSECHQNPADYSIFTCLTCHEQGETGDEHNGVGGYSYNSQACYECHPTGSAEGSFNHNSSNFPLTGAHLNADCIDCHANGYAGTPTLCFACHEGDFNLSVNPNHNAIGIPNECESCHTTNPGWEPATFAIHDNYYPLTGEHLTVATDCFICHEGDYNNTPNACVGCHLDDYNQSANPDHDAISIPTDCEDCHTTSPDWQPASFPIHNAYWQLTGAHQTIASDCYACHQGDYNNTPNECVGCHLDDYNGTNDPDHVAAQFPTDCELCHTTVAWIPSTFDHDGLYFPIYSGSHEGEWNTCSECHPNPANYSVFTCLTCHEQGETDDEHEDVSGYQYNSDACYACHPDGEEDKKKFNHN